MPNPRSVFFSNEPARSRLDRSRRARRRRRRSSPTLEIVDSRIIDWKITFVDTVADNGSSAALRRRGQTDAAGRHRDAYARVAFEKNGDLVGSGAGAAVLGATPYRAVAWLANTLAAAGLELNAGDLIMPGALCAMVPVARGDVVRADFGILGSVSVHFV